MAEWVHAGRYRVVQDRCFLEGRGGEGRGFNGRVEGRGGSEASEDSSDYLELAAGGEEVRLLMLCSMSDSMQMYIHTYIHTVHTLHIYLLHASQHLKLTWSGVEWSGVHRHENG